MQKNVKSIFLVATLLFLLVGVSAISASEVSEDNTIIQDSSDTVAPEVTTTTNNKIIDTTTKNIKTEMQTTDLYVSDTDGSDDNGGTNDSPYKTIQKALDQTSSDVTYNIHIAEGTYKGLGNTNLTVNGNYNINLIGTDNTVIDGEAKYDMKTELLPGEYYWDSSPEWYPFYNTSGNYAMNITRGTGTITLTNLTIQNCYSEGVDGGDRIDKYPFTTVDNYANLIIDNVQFIDNCAGVGAAIRNNHDSTLTVQNSNFTGNRKSTSSGNDGGAIYNNGTATITGSIFNDNYSRWGTILNDGQLTITDSRISNNHAYDGTSTYKYGAGIAADSGKADFFNPYTITGIETTIENCTFENNGQSDVYHGDGILIINNSTFKNSTGIYIATNDTNSQQTITNNQILDIKGSSLFSSLSVTTDTTFAIYQYLSPNTLITNNTITGKAGNGIILNSNATVTNNNMTLPITVRGNNTLIENNTINTTAVYAVNVAAPTFNNTVTNNTLESSLLYGNKAVNATRITVEDNTPELGQNITITDETYNDYFNEDGTIKEGTIESGSLVTLQDNFNNKKFIIDQHHITIKATGTLINSTFTVKNNGRVNFEKLRITNTNTENTFGLLIETEYNIFTNFNINIQSQTPAHAIIIKGDNNELSGAITLRGPSNPITNPNGLSDTMGIDIQSSNNIIQSGNVNVYSNNNTPNGTITAINIQSIDKEASNNTIYYFAIRAQSGDNIYGIKIINSTNNIIDTSKTTNIQLQNALENVAGVYITGKSDNNQILNSLQFVISGNLNGNPAIIINGTEYNINNTIISGIKNSPILILNAKNTMLNDVTTGTINNKTGIKILNSENTTVNKITLSNNQIGILVENSSNTNITNSTIKSPEPILLKNSNNNLIVKNYLFIDEENAGDSTVTIENSTNNIIENNTPIILRLTDENYDNYFDENSLYNGTTDYILLASDLYNKNLTFDRMVNFINLNNYTIYNGTLSLIGNANGTNITALKFYSNDERTTIIHSNASRVTYTNLSIYQENHENIVRTLLLENQVSYNVFSGNFTILGPEIKTNDGSASTQLLAKQYNIQSGIRNSNITVKNTTSDPEGHITLIVATNNTDNSIYNFAANTLFQYNNIDVSGNNIIISEGRSIYANYLNMTINANNNATLFKSNNTQSIQYNYNNIIINSNNTANLFELENVNSSMNQIQYSNYTINSPNTKIFDVNKALQCPNIVNLTLDINTNNLTLIKSKNATMLIGSNYGGINIPELKTENLTIIDADNSKITFCNVNINANVTNNKGIIATNNSNITLYTKIGGIYPQNIGNNININTTNPSPTITITDSTADIQYNNLTQNTTNTPLITSTNSNINVKENYLQTIDLAGNNTVEVIDSTATIENNTPSQTGYKSQITNIKTPETIIVKLNNPITVTVTDLFGEEITGTLTITDGETTSGSETNTINYTPQTTGQKTLTITYTDPTGKYDTTTTTANIEVTSPTLTVDPITATVGDVINITARITADDETITDINKGKVTFKVNGKTLKDTNGKVIYAKVVNGTATIENYIVPEDWAKEGTTIQAVFSGSAQCEKLTSEKTYITVEKAAPTLTTESVTGTAGTTIQLKATITDNDKVINTGKVVFKINGKTVKDANGKVIYAKVDANGEVSVDYTIPESFKAGTYTIEATFIAPNYDKITSNTTMTVVKS